MRSQEEARRLDHNYIGTEHILLGLLAEPASTGARALDRFGMSLGAVREEVHARIGTGNQPPKGRIPFTPRAKKVLEFGLREATALNHDCIGTEHLLLGLVREADGVGGQILKEHAGDLLAVRMAVLDLVPAGQRSPGRRWLHRRAASPDEPGQREPEPEEVHTTAAADSSLDEAARLAGRHPIGSHHLLLATLADPDSAAARALAALGVDLDRARDALRNADVIGTSDEEPEDAGRRHMVIRPAAGSLTVEATDDTLVGLGHAALAAVGDQADPPGAIRGDLPVSASLGNVWLALRDSLEDIHRRATAASRAPADGPDQPLAS